jgi:hypothetical protein
MQINQINLFGEEELISKVSRPSKIAKEITRPFKCVLCGKMVAKLEGTMCTDCYCEKLAKDRSVR